jgi:NTP pyrophosphatase (non-canonical NTP hydrolase)
MSDEQTTIQELREKIVAYVHERDWEQFHNPKDVALSLVLEAAEVLEHFQWKSPAEIEAYVKTNKNDIADELVDTLYWVILLSHYLKIDLRTAFDRKMAENKRKYPADKSKGRHDKYTAYQKGSYRAKEH